MDTTDLQGHIFYDYYTGQKSDYQLHTSYGDPEPVPLAIFFRTCEEFSELEETALEYCYGKTLDVGAGVGSFSLALQRKGIDVDAMEKSPFCCEIMKSMGVRHVICQDLWTFNDVKYDTVVLMMNGIGIAGKLQNVPELLHHIKGFLKPGGQILVDSSDIDYLYDHHDISKPEHRYYGEIQFAYEYKGVIGEWFDWVYVDEGRLREIASSCGFMSETIYRSDYDDFLIKLTLSK